MKKGLLLLGVLTFTAAPAHAAANKEHLQLLAEIRMLQEQNQQLQQLLGTLQDTLKTVTTKLDDQSAATRKAMADQTLAVSNIGDNVRISTVSQEIETLRQAITSQPPPQAVPNPAVAEPPAGQPPVGVPQPQS